MLVAALVGRDEPGPPEIRMVVADLPNVDHAIHAFDQVWAVTSALPDEYSLGPADASIVRIDPHSGDVTSVIDGLDDEPRLQELDGVVWAKVIGRIIGFDPDGTEVASLAWEHRGEMTADDDHLWVTDFFGATISAIDPATAEVRRTVETGAFPVAPISAFGAIWVPSVTDGTVTVIDDSTSSVIAVSPEQLTDVVAMPGDRNEVWVIDLEGNVFALDAADPAAVRRIDIGVAVNKVMLHDGAVFVLPVWGRNLLVMDAAGQVDALEEVETGATPFRALSAHGLAWVAGDGPAETLTVIGTDPTAIVAQLDVGTNSSNTTGPVQPIEVGDDVWLPNRGDDAIYVIAASS